MKKLPEDFQEALDYINFRQRLINIAKTKDILITGAATFFLSYKSEVAQKIYPILNSFNDENLIFNEIYPSLMFSLVTMFGAKIVLDYIENHFPLNEAQLEAEETMKYYSELPENKYRPELVPLFTNFKPTLEKIENFAENNYEIRDMRYFIKKSHGAISLEVERLNGKRNFKSSYHRYEDGTTYYETWLKIKFKDNREVVISGEDLDAIKFGQIFLQKFRKYELELEQTKTD
jgi:hypothetical protein